MAVALERPQDKTQAADLPMPYTHEEFERLAATYPELRMELTAEGELIIMPPTGGESGRRGFRLIGQLAQYLEKNEIGEGFDSSTGFTLPNGAERAPDLAWVERSRWEALAPNVREKFLPLCPDFVVEVLSPTDRLAQTQEKMQEYIANGARLGWLVNPRTKTVEIYRPDREVEVLENPATVSGEDVLPGFVLNLAKIWD